MEKKKVITISRSVQTVSEFDALLEDLKVQNPVKYEMRVKSGDFDRFRATLKDETKKEEKKEEVVEPTPKELLEEKTVPELKEMLEEKGLEAEGKKADLIASLLKPEEPKE